MADEDRATTFCPRCGKPIVWARRDLGGGMEEFEVVAWTCFATADVMLGWASGGDTGILCA